MDITEKYFLRYYSSNAKTNNNTIYMCLVFGLAIPKKGLPSKIYTYSKTFYQWLPYCNNLFTLHNRICGYQRRLYISFLHIFCCFEIPAGSIIYLTNSFICFAFFVYKYILYIFFLLFSLICIAHKRRIAHNIIALARWQYLLPIHPQSISLHNVHI